MQNHDNALKIQKYTVEKDISFSFDFVTKDKISKEIRNLDKRKSYESDE